MKLNPFICALALAGVSTLASATVINFEDIAAAAGSNNVEGDQVSTGYLFDSSTNHSHRLRDNFDSFNGTTWIGWDNNIGANTVTLSKVGGGTFSLTSIDFTEFFGTPNGTQVLVTGNVNGGGSLLQTVILDDIADGAGALNDFQTVGFNWANLDSVTFLATAGNGDRWFGVDNVVVNANAVPEPGSLALAGLALLAAVGAGRRKAL